MTLFVGSARSWTGNAHDLNSPKQIPPIFSITLKVDHWGCYGLNRNNTLFKRMHSFLDRDSCRFSEIDNTDDFQLCFME